MFSYPTEELKRRLGVPIEGSLQLGLVLATKFISTLTYSALSMGLLIRGGATVGPLHHSKNVVLGDALIEAYELESSVAIYPRIAVSRKLCAAAPHEGKPSINKDYDGISHYDYFKAMILAGGNPPGDGFKQRLSESLKTTRNTISSSIERFENEAHLNELAKWTWFKRHLEEAASSLPKALFM